jgi:hypothetical protein
MNLGFDIWFSPIPSSLPPEVPRLSGSDPKFQPKNDIDGLFCIPQAFGTVCSAKGTEIQLEFFSSEGDFEAAV